MKKVIIIRYGEIFLKGKNRGFFERALEENIKRSLQGFSYKLVKQIAKKARTISDEAEKNGEIIIEKPVSIAINKMAEEIK